MLVESIKLQNRLLQNIEWHNQRFNAARNQLFGVDEVFNLEQLIDVPTSLSDAVFKCRVLYGEEIGSVEFQPYFPRKVKTLRLLQDNEIEYTYKYENRLAFDRLLAQKEDADDILIVRNGFVTDTSFSNIVLFDGEKWVTPDTYLLNGTQRQRLLAEGFITETPVTPSDLKDYQAVKPINAMLDFESTQAVTILF